MNKDETINMLKERGIIHDQTILLGYRGSISHGTYRPNDDPNSIDDKDLLGVAIGDIGNYFSTRYFPGIRFDQYEKFVDEWDAVTYEFLKFVRLAIGFNPNVMSLLWLRDEHYLIVHPLGQELINNRDLFISMSGYQAILGYAYNQLKKMERTEFKGYMGEKRKELVRKFGYDTKNASHLIRLLRMGIEFLRDKKLNVFREHDADELIAIKNGEWSLVEVKNHADKLFLEIEDAAFDSNLSKYPNTDAINELCIRILSEWFKL